MKFICCNCFSSNTKDSKDSSIFECDKDEPTEYVVEKLAIKRVPCSLIATEEDSRPVIPFNSVTVSSPSTKTTDPQLLLDKKANVTYDSYYSTIPKSDLKTVSHSSAPPRETSAITLGSEDESEQKMPPSSPGKRALSEAEEKQLISQVLNKYSSLYTLDEKSKFPKDPCPLNFPKYPANAPVYVPEHLRSRIPVPPHKKFQAEIHQEDIPTAAAIKTELPPDLQKTINALGVANKPAYVANSPTKNRKHLRPVITKYAEEKELCSRDLNMGIDLQDFTQKQVQSSETNESLIIKKGVRIIDYSTDNKGIQYSDFALPKSSDSQVSSESESDSDTDPIQNKTSADSSFRFQQSRNVTVFPSTSSGGIADSFMNTATGYTATQSNSIDSHQEVTEINQLKGQSLKWKIIIKHHPKKDKN